MYDKRDTTYSLLIPERQKYWYRSSQPQDSLLYPSSAMNFINRLAVGVLFNPDTVPQQQIRLVKPAGFLKPTMVPNTRHDSSTKPWFPLAGMIFQPSHGSSCQT
jgi:hypothetical protein